MNLALEQPQQLIIEESLSQINLKIILREQVYPKASLIMVIESIAWEIKSDNMWIRYLFYIPHKVRWIVSILKNG